MANIVPPLGLQDFDDWTYYEVFEDAVLDPETLNFIIDFDSQKARACHNVQARSIRDILNKPRPPATSARWINLFAPNLQKDVVLELVKQFEFSPRLAGLMMSDMRDAKNAQSPISPTANHAHHRFSFHRNSSQVSRNPPDLEMEQLQNSVNNAAAVLDFNHYKLVNEVWHWSSTDFGPKYLCIGFNTLTNIGAPSKGVTTVEDPKANPGDIPWDYDFGASNLPRGKRIWSWLILCDDGTVISCIEDAFPASRPHWPDEERSAIKILRRNLLTVVRQLSKTQIAWRNANRISKFPIRPNMEPGPDSKVAITDSPGLLLYYLFDDWYTSYALVAKKEQQYATRLQALREKLFERPDVGLISSLHQAGRQLAVLKRMYQSYGQIIARILDKQKQFAKRRHQRAGVPTATAGGFLDRDLPLQAGLVDGESARLLFNELYGIPLPQAVLFRFERLMDRVNLYALTEIQECLDEKADLVFLNFNLITLKESTAIEKLTRVTILLAKATILFLPVSLMTGYFSTQIQDLQNAYTAKTYWVTFAIIVFLSFLFLLVFGIISGTVEGTLIYRSLTRKTWDRGKLVYKSYRNKSAIS